MKTCWILPVNHWDAEFLLPGVFLLPYIVFLVTCGIPLFSTETSLGQFSRQSGVTCWKSICLLAKRSQCSIDRGEVSHSLRCSDTSTPFTIRPWRCYCDHQFDLWQKLPPHHCPNTHTSTWAHTHVIVLKKDGFLIGPLHLWWCNVHYASGLAVMFCMSMNVLPSI